MAGALPRSGKRIFDARYFAGAGVYSGAPQWGLAGGAGAPIVCRDAALQFSISRLRKRQYKKAWQKQK